MALQYTFQNNLTLSFVAIVIYFDFEFSFKLIDRMMCVCVWIYREELWTIASNWQ